MYMYAKVENGGEWAAWLRSCYQHVCKAISHSVLVASAYKEMNNLVLSFGVLPWLLEIWHNKWGENFAILIQ